MMTGFFLQLSPVWRVIFAIIGAITLVLLFVLDHKHKRQAEREKEE